MIKLFGTVVIGINSRLPDPLKKELKAHEIGHAQLHGRYGYYFVLENTMFLPGKFERQADEFAAELVLVDSNLTFGESAEKFSQRHAVPVELVGVWLGRPDG